MIYVCPLAALASTAGALSQYRLLTLMSPSHPDENWKQHARGPHLHLAFHDIGEPRSGLIAPDEAMMSTLIDFGREASDTMPLLIHCWAGISRSSAAAYILACVRNEGHERAIAEDLRHRAPFATPNPLMVSLGDRLLSRGGRMTAAVAAISRGTEACVGLPYRIPLIRPVVPDRNKAF